MTKFIQCFFAAAIITCPLFMVGCGSKEATVLPKEDVSDADNEAYLEESMGSADDPNQN